MDDRRDDPFLAALRSRADVVVSDVDRAGGLNTPEILAWRAWFDERASKLRSSGGRPTNPHWNIKRQVSLTTETWDALNRMAAACGESGPKLAAGQMAAFLLEDAVASSAARIRRNATEITGESTNVKDISGDPRFRAWRMPELFSGRAA